MAGRSFKPTLFLEPVPSDDRNILLSHHNYVCICVHVCSYTSSKGRWIVVLKANSDSVYIAVLRKQSCAKT